MSASTWLLFVSHLPSREAAPRMRVWRGLRALGAGILRDGVYVLPRRPHLEDALAEHADTVTSAGGQAHVLICPTRDRGQERDFRSLFDRGEDYAQWERSAAELVSRLPTLSEAEARREEAGLRRALEVITAVDFFPRDGLREQAEHTLTDVAGAVTARFSPEEPTAVAGTVTRRDPDHYRGRLWATRRRLWVDRVASAWLIRRFIDQRARFAWLERPADCPVHAVGFDFDGAEFSHVGERVTFQVLLAAFALDDDAPLARIGALVRYLDAGGAPVAEAAGVLALLAGARDRCAGDDEFLDAAGVLLDDLYTAFATSG